MGRRGGGWLFEGGKYASLYDVLAFFLAACCCWGDMIWLTCTFFNSLTFFFSSFFLFSLVLCSPLIGVVVVSKKMF